MLKAWNFSELNQVLQNALGSTTHLLPELLLTGALLLLVILDLLFGKKKLKWVYGFALISIAVVLTSTVMQFNAQPEVTLFSGMLRLDGLAFSFKMLFALAALMAVLLTFSKKQAGDHESGEYHTLLFGTLLGTFLMVMTTNLLMLYLSLELVSVCSYILAGFSRKVKSAESSLKYLLFGALSSGVMLYGLSLLYGFTGSMDFTSESFLSGLAAIDKSPLFMAVFMVLVGFLFKLSAVPFHIWTPDVYEGAPTPVVAFFSVAPKLAGVVLVIRFWSVFHLNSDLGLEAIGFKVLAVLAILTMTVGNFSALWQKNAKRMMAYSSIGHAGLFLAAVLTFSKLGLQSILFYGMVYLFMNFAAFLLIQFMADRNQLEEIEDYAGLGLKNPLLGVLMVVVMISLTGLPPTAGFTAKLLVFTALLDSYQVQGENMTLYLLIAGLINTVVALFYYLKIPYQMYFKEGNTNREKLSLNLYDKALALSLTLPLIGLFFLSDWLINLLNHIKLLF